MKRYILGLFSILFILTACGQSTPALQTTPQPDQPTTTSSPFPTATPTRTALPSATPTASITPLPTIPTFTPTFDVSTILTVTPAPKAECPIENPNLIPSFPIQTNENFFIENSAEILQYLNEGGELKKAVEKLGQAMHGNTSIVEDVTGDKTPELVFVDYADEPKLHILSCEGGKYQDILPDISDSLTGYSTATQATVADFNRNGISNILLKTRCNRKPGCASLFILEWNGSEFINRIEQREIFEGFPEIKIENANNDGIPDIIITQNVNGGYAYYMGFPWRMSTYIYIWNGSQYALQNIQYSKPEYQFQAIQDGDRIVLLKDYDVAIKLYEVAIKDKNFLPYSRQLSEHMEWLYWNPMSISSVTEPPPDLTEFPRLAAYAYYRIMLIHLVQGHESDANTVYNTLQEKFTNDQYGRPYVEMATAFWDAYQSTHKMYAGCAAAIQYAAEHPEILTPLGSDYHGAQSYMYKPEDVCPFR